MKKLVIALLAIFISHGLQAQYDQEIENQFNQAYQLSQNKKFKQALPGFLSVLQKTPSHVNSQIMASWCYLVTGDIKNATVHADNAHYLDQYYDVPYLSKAYAGYVNNDPQAEYFLKTYFWVSQDLAGYDNIIKDFDDLIAAGIKPDLFKSLKANLKSIQQSVDRSFGAVGQLMNDGAYYLQQNQLENAAKQFDAVIKNAHFNEPYAYFRPLVIFQIGRLLEYYNVPTVALSAFELALAEMPKHKYISAYTRTVVATKAGDYYMRSFNDEKAFTLLSSYLRHANTLPSFANHEKGEFLIKLCQTIAEKSDKHELLREYANLLLSIESPDRITQAHFSAHGHFFLGLSYLTGRMSGDRAMAKQNFDKAIAIGKQAGLSQLLSDIRNVYAMYYFSQGDYANAIALINESADDAIARKDFITAQTLYNNLGAMYYGSNDYRNATFALKKAIDIAEKYRDQLEGELKLNFMAQATHSYSFLASSYLALNDYAGLFEAQNLQRGRVLSETLSRKDIKHSLTLQQFQKMLAPDEAAIIYSQMLPGQVIIHVITRNNAFATMSDQLKMFVNLKQQYLDQINKAAYDKPGYKPVDPQKAEKDLIGQISQSDMDDMMQLTRTLLQRNIASDANMKDAFLKSYYTFLIAPVINNLNVKKLLIMPDGLLNFLPFESLKSSDGKYLVEKFDIRYVQSPEVKHIISTRNYEQRSKSLLAMGGAIYQNMNETSERIRAIDKMLALQSQANANVLYGKSQREIYAALGFGQLNDLPGTLKEVNTISNYFKGNADVFTGDQMTENKIKSLSKSGELKNYKILHLATHGFAIPQIPQLSGIAMCIFPQMQGHEDGYLTAPEIAQLGMEADLAVLSACETGLGKIYGGEGVAGLTQSLLIGGANRAIVSLWPVSDEGTMYFMTGLYDLTQNKGKSYDEAVNVMKRRFITGEFGSALMDTSIWAPFVHYGE